MLTRQLIIDDLFATMQETITLFDGPRVSFEKSYGPGKWTVRDILVHLSDTETVLLDRLRRVASEEKPVLCAFDENRWASILFYEQRDMHVAKMQYQAARRSVIELATVLEDRFDKQVGQHTEAGPSTFEQILKKVAQHNRHHLEQMNAAIAGKEWVPPAK